MKKQCYLSFETRNGNKYLFDSNTGTVLPVNDLLAEAIELYESLSIEQVHEILLSKYPQNNVDGALDFINRWFTLYGGFYRMVEDGAYVNERARSFKTTDIQEYLQAGFMFQMVLNLTEDCNLRCRYCYLSENYNFTRNRTNKLMTVETGKKALDYFFGQLKPLAKRNPGKSAAVTFYGGEPFLNFVTMKQLVEYCKKYSPVPIYFNLTTNGTVFSDEIFDFLVSNHIYVVISLDGTKENHDRNRVFANGQGTFNIVFNNIKRFKERYPNYDQIGLVCVYDFLTDLEANEQFFEEHNLPPIIFVNGVFNLNTDYYQRFSVEDEVRFYQQKDRLLKKYFENKIQGKLTSTFLKTLFELSAIPVIYRPRFLDSNPTMIPFTGTCVPGMKISVRTDGTFDICERVNSTMPIGKLETGLNFEAIKEIIYHYNESITKGCWGCSISRNCPLCYAQCMKDAEFNYPNITCKQMVESFQKNFSLVYSILEVQPDAFKGLEDPLMQTILFKY
ncbi:MAG: radical SAM protein [Firmicutes bacterium]|nr:radical SAM protein [Bacillota bacterium]